MYVIIPAAGYATRLSALTENQPKHLLKVKDKTILDYIIDKLSGIEVEDIIIVTNNKYYKNFLEWNKNFKILNDNTTSNSDRLGAIGDICFALDHFDIYNEEIMIIAGDNLFKFSLERFYDFYKQKNSPVVAVFDVKDLNLAKQFGNITLDAYNKIINFIEKPQDPKTTLSATMCYIFDKESTKLFKEYKNLGLPMDKMGDFISFLIKKKNIYGYIFKEDWFDIGNLSELERAQREF